MNVEYPSENWKDYELIDCGEGEKLERFGRFVMARPEPKAIWSRSMGKDQWDKMCHTHFIPGAGFGKAGKEDVGTWTRDKKMDEQWHIIYPGEQKGLRFDLRLGLTSFKHVGVFPEQASNWEFIYRNTRPGMKVLNLFAYTGGASLAAKAAGGDVTHVDSVRQVVNWASGNMESSRMDGIHWVVEDAMKFAKREARRGNRYSGIILDPPAYGHGPNGERWKLDDCLFELLKTISQILEPKDSFMVLNLYSNGYSALLGETVVKQALRLKGDYTIESGELALRDRFGKDLPLSIVVRLKR